ncbi:MAG: effector binding domain-containing protein [Bacteroidetes bacterium]|nr:effector binding domain-containing protein [Bacteroidota bacterium]
MMEIKVQVEPFKMIGISTKTTNQDGQSAKDLGELWGRFYEENIISKISNKISEEVYSLYTDYESDYEGKYTAMIGLKVVTLDNIPEGLIGRKLNGGNYIKIMAKGKMPEAIMNAWQEIWDRDDELKRQYTTDFEVYTDKSQKGENSEVEIFIATE